MEISLGTPDQKFDVAVDTTSSNLWVVNTDCSSKNCQGDPLLGVRKSHFNESASSTFTRGNGRFSTAYDGGNAYGNLEKDVMRLGGLSVKHQDFGSVEYVPAIFNEQPIDGVLGVGWQPIAFNGTTSPMQNIISQLDAPIFTMYLNRTDHIEGSSGQITFGALDSENCDAQIHYVPNTYEAYWGFSIDSVSIGRYSRPHSEQVIIDSASSWIGAPPAFISAIVQTTGATYDWSRQAYTVACSSIKTQPDLTFTIGGLLYPIKATEYILDLDFNDGQCALGFFGFADSANGPTWILGDAFIRSYCHVFDFGYSRIGLSKARQNY